MRKPPQPNITHDSHYVPQAALKRWSLDGKHVFAYQLLVPDTRVPKWKKRGIRSLARQRDLYTVFSGRRELDDFERWLNVEFEHRGVEALDRLVNGLRLTEENWSSIILFLAAQDLRTPLGFIEWLGWCEQTIPALIDRVLSESVRRLEDAAEKGIVLEQKPVQNELSDLFRVSIQPSPDPAEDRATLRAEMTAGRRSWIAGMRHRLTGIAKRLCEYRWSVAYPHGTSEWPLTDNPVLRLNYDGPRNYNFRGGWGQRGTEILMPVSPRHLLYVQVGRKHDNRFTFKSRQTEAIQRFLVERAHRWVFATKPAGWVVSARPRIVDPFAYEAEEKAWKEFHRDQLQSESRS